LRTAKLPIEIGNLPICASRNSPLPLTLPGKWEGQWQQSTAKTCGAKRGADKVDKIGEKLDLLLSGRTIVVCSGRSSGSARCTRTAP
jgi:hypothetical protein